DRRRWRQWSRDHLLDTPQGEAMIARPHKGRRRGARRLLAGTALAVGIAAATTAPADAATTATFSAGTLSVFGDSANNSIVVSRDAAGKILVNGGAISVVG